MHLVQTLNKHGKENRLRKSGEFKDVTQTGRKFVTGSLVFFAKETETRKLGLIVTKKIGNAVVRNKIKRKLRDIFRTVPAMNQNRSYVVIARQKSRQFSYQELKRDFYFALSRLNPETDIRNERANAVNR